MANTVVFLEKEQNNYALEGRASLSESVDVSSASRNTGWSLGWTSWTSITAPASASSPVERIDRFTEKTALAFQEKFQLYLLVA